eukprot:TRINITY_DN118940_c0_g1_i1.p2 TRINITY_DN118940_c0_g1~~TRINITY_DN118940_c0_g1_i1.p2  ORF type:complete len:150 (+),score=65.62 TRINITY_DN118940_c0_g1_i1:67-516(+)
MSSVAAKTLFFTGGCHCGAVRWKLSLPKDKPLEALRCNCSICTKKGFVHIQVDAWQLDVQGTDNLTTYTFNTHTAKHHFCKTCGVASYYVPRSHPKGFSVNLNCLNDPKRTIPQFKVTDFDGSNWEANVATIATDDQVVKDAAKHLKDK